MKIAIKNFLTTLRRYKVASVLNIAGMTLAFLAFYVIMSQVYYNITYNRPIKDSDRTYILVTRFAEADWMALEPTYSRNIIKLQIINNQTLFGVHSKSKSF